MERANPTFLTLLPTRTTVSDIDDLPQDMRQEMTGGVEFDTEQFKIHAISIGFEVVNPSRSRKAKKRSLDAADIIILRLDALDERIEFVGQFPRSRNVDGQTLLDFEHNIFGEIQALWGSAGISSKLKHRLKRANQLSISASRTDNVAIWAFHRHWIQNVADYNVQLLCRVPNPLPDQDRALRAEVRVYNNSRLLDIRGRRIGLGHNSSQKM